MGSGISKTYPAGILKTPKTVRFGNTEVRLIRRDSWEDKPLLNTHQVARIEAQIRAAVIAAPPKPVAPAPLPQIKPLPTKPSYPVATMCTVLGVATLTGVVCAVAGPFGAIVPVVALSLWGASKALSYKPKANPTQRHATILAAQNLEKLALEQDKLGNRAQAKVYRDMALQYRHRYQV